MKKMIALAALAGVLVCAVPVSAAPSPSAGSVSPSASSTATAAVEATAVSVTVTEAAAAQGKSVGEYTNNAVVEVPGLAEVTPMGQGGHVIINGAPSNVIFFLTKPSAAVVSSAKQQAAALGGKVLNVVGTTSQAVGKFGTAQVNFYAKGVRPASLSKFTSTSMVNG